MGLFLLIPLLVAKPAIVIEHWIPNTNILVNGLPPKYFKVYWGSQAKTYTNNIVVGLTNLISTPYTGYDQYNCTWSTLSSPYITITINGLVLNQQIYTAYSVINSNGVESPFINESTCGYTVTNNSGVVLIPPTNFKVNSVKP